MPSAVVQVFETSSEEETIAVGRRLANLLPPVGCVVLSGQLGVGKTTLAKGIIEGRGAASQDEVNSPTFTLIHEFAGGEIYHVDLYRLETEEEVRSTGLDEILRQPALVLIEWGERFPQFLPREVWRIEMEEDSGARRIVLRGPDSACARSE
jgi:tRNA threonylcarbamoyladenosine biosynthesis protein TsaE